MANLKNLLGSAALAGMMAVTPAKSATISVSDPVTLGSSIGLAATSENTDSGAVYNSNEYNSFSTLGSQLYDLSHNASTYSSQSDLMTDWTLGIDGSASNNWNLTVGSGPTLVADHTGEIPNITYDEYSFGKNQQALVSVPLSQLELSGNSTYDTFTFADTQSELWDPLGYDALIVKTGTTLADELFGASNYTGIVPDLTISPGFTGQEGIFNYNADDVPQYALVNPNDFTAIPEPSNLGLIGSLGALAYVASRRPGKVQKQDTKYD